MNQVVIIAEAGVNHNGNIENAFRLVDVAESAGYQIKGILDVPENVGNKVLGYSIIGTDDQIINYVDNAVFIVTVGHIKDAALLNQITSKKSRCGR